MPLVEDADVIEESLDFNDALRAWARALPPDLREALGKHMDAEFERQLEAEIAVVDEQVKATMPDGWSPTHAVRLPDGSGKAPE